MGVTRLVLPPLISWDGMESAPNPVDPYTKQNVGGGGGGIVTMDQGSCVTWRDVRIGGK